MSNRNIVINNKNLIWKKSFKNDFYLSTIKRNKEDHFDIHQLLALKNQNVEHLPNSKHPYLWVRDFNTLNWIEKEGYNIEKIEKFILDDFYKFLKNTNNSAFFTDFKYNPLDKRKKQLLKENYNFKEIHISYENNILYFNP
jgi:hypothetical protein